MAKEPTLLEIYARCLDIVERVTRISFGARFGLDRGEFEWLESIADELLGLNMSISRRRSCTTSQSVDESEDEDELPF